MAMQAVLVIDLASRRVQMSARRRIPTSCGVIRGGTLLARLRYGDITILALCWRAMDYLKDEMKRGNL